MRGAVLHGRRDVRFEERDAPKIVKPTDAIIRMAVTCVCGSDLWDYRGINPITQPKPMGHEYCGIVEEVGRAVTAIKPGQFVIGSFFASDNTCPNCQAGYPSSCQHREFVVGRRAGDDEEAGSKQCLGVIRIVGVGMDDRALLIERHDAAGGDAYDEDRRT